MIISIPAKTFILGEYCALLGGPSLIFTHTPYFKLTLNRHDTGALCGIHPDSPGGKLYQSHRSSFMRYQLDFQDPYRGLGGLGASSAQYLGIYQAHHQLNAMTSERSSLLESYWRHAYQKEGMKPSGADVVAQSVGGLCFFHPKTRQCLSYDWPFESLSLLLVHTNNKLATHEHLKTLTLENDIGELNILVQRAHEAVKKKDPNAFLDAVSHFGEGLQQRQLVAPHTLNLLKQLHACPDILAAKGAGAMGADILLILCQKQGEKTVRERLQQHGLSVIATEQALSEPHRNANWLGQYASQTS